MSDTYLSFDLLGELDALYAKLRRIRICLSSMMFKFFLIYLSTQSLAF